MSVDSNPKSSKRDYIAPRVQVYGDVLKLTAAGTSGLAEGSAGSSTANDPTRRR